MPLAKPPIDEAFFVVERDPDLAEPGQSVDLGQDEAYRAIDRILPASRHDARRLPLSDLRQVDIGDFRLELDLAAGNEAEHRFPRHAGDLADAGRAAADDARSRR